MPVSTPNPGAAEPADAESAGQIRPVARTAAEDRAVSFALEAIARIDWPLLRMAEQLHRQNAELLRSFSVGADYAAIWKIHGLGSTLAQYDQLVKSFYSSPGFEVVRSLGRLQDALYAGAHVDLMAQQSIWWKNSPLAFELAGVAQSHVELIGWAARSFPARELLADTARPAEQWNRSVLELPERPNLLAPVRAGHTTTALTGANLLVSLQDEEAATEEAVVLVESSVLEPWEVGRVELASELYFVLGGFDPMVPDLLRGAWEDVTRQGPAAAEKAAHLVVEVVDRTLRAAAPDVQVLEWHAKNGRSAKELHRDRPTRALRVRYLAREFKDRALIGAQEDALAKLVSEVLESGQGVKHSSNGGLVIARSMLMGAETLLVQLLLRS